MFKKKEMIYNNDTLYSKAVDMISKAIKLPVVKVDREAFLREQFKGDKYLDIILEHGPQEVYTAEYLREKADVLIDNVTKKTSTLSFLAGMPGNPVYAVAAGTADVFQFFAFALNLSQQIAYLFGESNLSVTKSGELSSEVKARYIAYIGVMFGVSGAVHLINTVAMKTGEKIGESVATKAFNLSVSYPMVKKVGSLIGKKMTRKTVSKSVSKAVPILGGAVSGGLTYISFKKMGKRLADALYKARKDN